MIINEKLLTTAGGKISCHRCQALSKRTKKQCARPALKGKQVCDFHGGKSSGSRTAEGKERSRQAHIKSGAYTQESSQRHNFALLNLAYLYDLIVALKMSDAPRPRGPRPKGYKKLDLQSALQFVMGNE
jgi:hypothetical protein